MTTYADSGVNIELGDDVSKILYNAAKETWKNRKGKLGELIVPFDDFTGIRAIDVSGLPKGTLMNIGFDGVGTKSEIAEREGNHSTIAFDLFGMVVEDAEVRGAEAVLIGSILDVNSLGNNKKTHVAEVKQLAQGYIAAAEASNVAIVNGEVAELGARVRGYSRDPGLLERLKIGTSYIFTGKFPSSDNFSYNWGAGVVWFARKDRMFTGYEIQPGDSIVGFFEDGLRSNGVSLQRWVFERAHGHEWHKARLNGKTLGELALTPTRIYTRAVIEATGGYDGEPKAEVHGIAHITGGGLPGKLGRVLKPSGLGAILDNPFQPCDLMLYCQERGNVPDEGAYKTWNMGHGMVIITPASHCDKVMEIADVHGIKAKDIGKVTSEKGIRIKSKGYYKEGKVLSF